MFVASPSWVLRQTRNNITEHKWKDFIYITTLTHSNWDSICDAFLLDSTLSKELFALNPPSLSSTQTLGLPTRLNPNTLWWSTRTWLGGERLTGRSVFGKWKQENDGVLVLQSPLTVDAADVRYSVSAFFFSWFLFFLFFFLKHQQGVQKPPTEDQTPVLIDIVCSHRRKVGACRRGRAPLHTGVLKGWKKDFKGLKSLNSGH